MINFLRNIAGKVEVGIVGVLYFLWCIVNNIKIRISLCLSMVKYKRVINSLSEEEKDMLKEEVKKCKEKVRENIKDLFKEDLSFCMDYMEQFLEGKDENCKLFFTTGLNIFLRTQEMEEVDINKEGSEDIYKEKFSALRDRYGVRPWRYVYPFMVWCSIMVDTLKDNSISMNALLEGMKGASEGGEYFWDYIAMIYEIGASGRLVQV